MKIPSHSVPLKPVNNASPERSRKVSSGLGRTKKRLSSLTLLTRLFPKLFDDPLTDYSLHGQASDTRSHPERSTVASDGHSTSVRGVVQKPIPVNLGRCRRSSKKIVAAHLTLKLFFISKLGCSEIVSRTSARISFKAYPLELLRSCPRVNRGSWLEPLESASQLKAKSEKIVMPAILCIDDDRNGLALRKLILESKGYVVLAATNGPAGIKLAQRAKVDAVVLDFQMPYMDGEQVARILRHDCPNLPIILLSGSGEVPNSALLTVDEYLQKGCPDLLELLDRALLRLTEGTFPRAA
jgi:CheY-like chemotaxis protein